MSSIQSTVIKINRLLLQIKHCLSNHNSNLPLVRCTKEFDCSKKITIRVNQCPIQFKLSTILTIIKELLLNNKFITKRNLYYQLINYYEYYLIIDKDLQVLSDTLKVDRSGFNIIASNKLQLFWFNHRRGLINNLNSDETTNEVRLELCYKKFTEEERKHEEQLDQGEQINLWKYGEIQEQTQKYTQQQNGTTNDSKQTAIRASHKQTHNTAFIHKQHIVLAPHQIFKLPNCPRIQVSTQFFLPIIDILYPQISFNNRQLSKNSPKSRPKINLLILQKQSMFEILTESLTYKAPAGDQNWLLMTSKGYPDKTALQFVNEIYQKSRRVGANIEIYYIGDLDVYGVDIFFNYAIGTESYDGVWPIVRWFNQMKRVPQIVSKSKEKYQKNRTKDNDKVDNILRCESQFRILTNEQKKKAKDMLKRPYFQQEKFRSANSDAQDSDRLFVEKMKKWRQTLQDLLQTGTQCQIQSYFKHLMYPFDLIEQMIEQHLYV